MREAALVAVTASGPLVLSALERVWEEGDALLPVDPRLAPGEVRALLERMRPARLIGPGGASDLPDAVPVEEGVALVVPTSGTSGESKGVELTHAALAASAEAVAKRLGSRPDDRWLCCLPLAHIAGLSTLVRSILSGSAPVIHDRFEPGAIARETSATLISLVPTMLLRLLDAKVELSHYKAVLVGGGPIPGALIERARASGARVVTTYGMTETCGGCVYDGLPLDGVELSIFPQSEVLLRGPTLMRGYRLRPDLTAQAVRDGWFHTWDSGEIAADGRLRVLGRLDDLIITGGEKVVPEEVEALLRDHPLVADVAVAGIPDDERGQRVAAAVVVRGGVAPTLEELREFVASRSAPFKAPRDLVIVDRIPRGPLGKPSRAEVTRLFGG